MQRENQIFWGIILGTAIIGACVYFGLQEDNSDSMPFSGQVQTAALTQPQQKPAEPESPPTGSPAFCGAESNTIVTKVIDGDTVVIEGGYHIRLLGIDADEKGYPCYEPAKTRLESLILSKQVLLEKDKTDLDQYGRCLRYIFVGNMNIDVQLVKEGLAVARFYEPDVKYRAEISDAEKQAQTSKAGCKWSGGPQISN